MHSITFLSPVELKQNLRGASKVVFIDKIYFIFAL